MSSNFNIYSKYYNLLYADKDYNSEAKYISECIQAELPGAKSILEFGSGTGTCGLILKNMGYDIFGVELSSHMTEQALANGFPCRQGDITSFEINNKFDCVISLFHVISYLSDNSSLEKAFMNAANCLNTDGLFIFDVWYSPAVYSQKPESRIKHVENEEIKVIRIAEPIMRLNENIVDVKYTVLVKDKINNKWEEFAEVHPMRHFSLPEISLLAKHTGFDIIKAEEFLTREKPSAKTWGVNFILRKNG